MTAPNTISSIMGVLDLISSGDATRNGSSNNYTGAPNHESFSAADFRLSDASNRAPAEHKSAISVLREHRELEKERQMIASSLVLPTKPKVRPNPLLDQIGSSTTEAPTYWKNVGQSQSRKKVVSSSIPVLSKAVRMKRQKGESYKDKHSSKLLKVGNRKARLEHIKRQ